MSEVEERQATLDEQVAELWAYLPTHGVGTIRLNQAIRRLKDGVPFPSVVERAFFDEEQARNMWLEKAFQPWCKRHGLSLEQGLSVTFCDHAFNPDEPGRDLVTMKDLMWNGQAVDFAAYLQKKHTEQKITTAASVPIEPNVEFRWFTMQERLPSRNQNVVFHTRSENGHVYKKWVSRVDDIGWADDHDGYHKALRNLSATNWYPLPDHDIR